MTKVQLDQDSKDRLRLIADLLRVLDDTGNLTVGGVTQTNSILTDFRTDFNAEDFATEATLQSVLAAIQNGTDYEAKLVVDNDGATWLEVRIWNTDTSTFDAPVYYAAGSNTVGTPAAPINYINPLTLLATVANNTTGLSTEATLLSCLQRLFSIEEVNNSIAILNADIRTNTTGLSQEATQLLIRTADLVRNEMLAVIRDESLEQGLTLDSLNGKDFATQTTLELVRLLLVSVDGKDFATQTTLAAVLTELQSKADLSETQPVSAASLPLPTGASTEVTLEAARILLASLDTKDFATQTTLSALNVWLQANVATENTLASVDTKLNVATRVPNLLRTSSAGTIAPAVYDFSVYNAGEADGTLLGAIIKSKEALNFSAGGLNHVYGAGTISYDGTGTELVIIYNS